jgi:hypothetical protein
MASVSLDLFRLPECLHGKKRYDTLALCVDRHSGWIIAAPVCMKGLTAAKVARKFFARGWDLFAVPSMISSDKDSRWVGAWWTTMCAMLGIQHAVAQPYHHRANGRAERAGLQVFDILRKIRTQSTTFTWVEALPSVLRHIHDQPGVSGFSPYEILFGRQRSLAGLPYTPSRESVDALQFFSNQAAIDAYVSRELNESHKKRSDQVDSQRPSYPPLSVGQKVLYLRPRETHQVHFKVEARWIGPCIIKERVGEQSYSVETKPGHIISAHRVQLLEWKEDENIFPLTPLFTYKPEEEKLEIDEWEVDHIAGHKIVRDGTLMFHTHWKGFPASEATWEPVGSFIHRYSSDFVD